MLARFGLGASDLRWRVEVANLKPFHYTLAPDDRVAASVDVRGDDTQRQALTAGAPPGAAQPLIPRGVGLGLGSV
ncbi:MAG: hypothetical protein ACRD0K_14060 [Egibacteraceae bacterium]